MVLKSSQCLEGSKIPWGKGGPATSGHLCTSLWGLRGPPQCGQDRARARGASSGFKGISAPASWAAFSKCFPHWPQDSVGKAAEVDS